MFTPCYVSPHPIPSVPHLFLSDSGSRSRCPSLNFQEGELVENIIKQEIHNLAMDEGDYLLQKTTQIDQGTLP